MTPTLLLVLRLVHVVLGVFWAGTVLFIGLLLFPSVRAAGPAGGQVMARLMERRMPVWLHSTSLLVIASGIWLYWRATGGFQADLMLAGPNLVFGTGGLMAILATVIGLGINAPTAGRIGRLSASIQGGGSPPSPEQAAEIQRLQGILFRGAQAAAALLLLATAAMAVARYVA